MGRQLQNLGGWNGRPFEGTMRQHPGKGRGRRAGKKSDGETTLQGAEARGEVAGRPLQGRRHQKGVQYRVDVTTRKERSEEKLLESGKNSTRGSRGKQDTGWPGEERVGETCEVVGALHDVTEE